MPKKSYMPLTDSGKCALLLHVKTNLPTFFTTLGIEVTTAQVVQQGADALAFAYHCQVKETLVAAGQEATAARNRLRDGDPSNFSDDPVTAPFPNPPPDVPGPVMPGVIPRFRAFVQWLKGLPGYTEAIGEALKIVGEDSAPVDLGTVKPTLSLRVSGGKVEIDWGWNGLQGQVDGLEIHVERGDGNFVLLTIDTRPGYIDTTPFTGAAKWRYKAIWRKDDQRVGLWSDVAEITVG